MIKIFWKKSERNKHRIRVELEAEISEWQLESDILRESIKDRTIRKIIEGVAEEISRRITYEYTSKLEDLIAKEILTDDEIRPLIKQKFVEEARKLLRLEQ